MQLERPGGEDALSASSGETGTDSGRGGSEDEAHSNRGSSLETGTFRCRGTYRIPERCFPLYTAISGIRFSLGRADLSGCLIGSRRHKYHSCCRRIVILNISYMCAKPCT